MQEPVEDDLEDEDLKARMKHLCKPEDWPLSDFQDGPTGRQVKSSMHAGALMVINVKEARPLLGSTSSFAKVLLIWGAPLKPGAWCVTCRVAECMHAGGLGEEDRAVGKDRLHYFLLRKANVDNGKSHWPHRNATSIKDGRVCGLPNYAGDTRLFPTS